MIKLMLPVAVPNGDLAAQCATQFRDYLAACCSPGLDALCSGVIEAYQEYIANRGNPAAVTRDRFPRLKNASCSSVGPGDLLYDCYESGRGVDRSILQAVKARSTGYCPYCCTKMVTKPRNRSPDRDHMLPRSKFPELSLLSVNLLAVCDSCNDAKGTEFETCNGEWLWIHPYFDEFLADRVLNATVIAVNGTVQVKFSIDATGLSPASTSRLLRHVKRLEVLGRMAEYVDDALASQITTVVSLFESSSCSARELGQALRASGTALLKVRANDPLGVALVALGSDESVLLDALRRRLNDPPSPTA